MLTLSNLIFAVSVAVLLLVLGGVTWLFGLIIKEDTGRQELTWGVWMVCVCAAMLFTESVLVVVRYGLLLLAGMPI